MKNNCTLCIKYNFDPGCGGFSDITPGYAWSMSCDLGHWDINGESTDEDEFVKALNHSAKCKDFEGEE